MTADFPPELKGEDFRILPMSYVLDGVEYDGVTRPFLTPHEFYTALERGAQASTSMVPVESAKEYFLSMLGEGKDILHISFPAAMSGCYDGYLKAADLAIKEYPERRIVVIDGKSACSGEGLLAYYAMQKRDGGATLDETLLTPLTESFSSGGVRKRPTLAGSVVMSKVPWWSMVPPRRR